MLIGVPTFREIHLAAARLRGVVRRTPVFRFESLGRDIGGEVFLKAENLQVCGAFKYRGASNAILQMSSEQLNRGVATHSSGNHGFAVAIAARRVGARATVVVPDTIAKPKLRAIEKAGAEVRFTAPTPAAREAEVRKVVQENGATIVHPYDCPRVIAGQGTAAIELLDECPEIDTLVAPVSGGGLLSGTAIAGRGVDRNIRIFGAEPELAGDAAISLKTGNLAGTDAHTGITIADGLRACLSWRTFAIIRREVTAILTVGEAEIVSAMRRTWEETKLVIEPSAAVAIAVIVKHQQLFRGSRIGVIISGGNVELDTLPWQT